MKQTSLVSLLAVLVSISPVLTGCKKEAAKGGAAPPAYAVQAVIAEAKVQAVNETLSLVGSVAANEMVEIKSETDGTLEEVLFTEGQKVKQGDLLIRLDESKFTATVNEAEANFKLTETTYDRNKQLLRDKLISQQEYDQAAAQYQASKASLELKKRLLKDARIYAPFKGMMSSRQVSPGQVIARNTTLTWLIDLDPVKVELNVPERFVSQLKIGQKIEITVAAYPGRTFLGEVFFVAPFVESATRTALVKARIDNPNAELKPGMFANLNLTLKLKEDAIVIPESAVTASGDRNIVYVLDKEDTAQIRPVKIGIRQAGLVEIISGVKPGERVVAEGIQKIRPGAKVKASSPTSAPATTGGKP
ncbi:MAG: efflux RND transporter periplasmic adaptor subunit [Verrucomicrobia bacterium]|nr:efflux RND transporter periplasmic adaptor subunit [Verrucomicrobiota bacterium]